MINEEDYKLQLITNFNQLNSGWVDGDLESVKHKTPDLVNHNLKIAIEIKDDTLSKKPQRIGTQEYASYDIKKLNKRFYEHIRNANHKFRQLPEYRTVLILRTNLPMAEMVKDAIEGVHTFIKVKTQQNVIKSSGNWITSSNLSYVGRKDKHQRSEIGCFLIKNEDGYSYFVNSYAHVNKVLSLDDLSSITGLRITNLFFE